MNLNQNTLVKFEAERKANNYIPPEGSDSFYDVGDGKIDLYVKRSNPEDYRFDMTVMSGSIPIGGAFTISGDISDINNPYGHLSIMSNSILINDGSLTISKGNLLVHGSLVLKEGSQLIIKDGAIVTFYIDSTINIADNCKIIVEDGCSISIYGKTDIHLNSVDNLLNIPGIMIDSSAVMNVVGLELLGNRIFSATDYYTELSNMIINKNTQGEKNTTTGRIGYNWVGGNPLKGSQLLRLSTLYGDSILGDFKLQVLGYPLEDIRDLQIITSLNIESGTTMYISEEFHDNRYIHPELYIGVIIGNSHIPGKCIIKGTMIVDGANSSITVDRGAILSIEYGGELYLRNGAVIKSTYNEDMKVFNICGTLIIDDISQIGSFNKYNIVIGDRGKVIILNPDTGEKRILLSTPNGIKESKLYELFEDRIDHIEYNISNNTGISIDKYYEFYSKDFTDWFGGRRIEKAVHDGILVWHDGGFIELDHDIIPWVNSECTLIDAGKIFKTFGSSDNEKLQDAVNRLKYAGFGNILFRFVNGNEIKEVLLTLEGISIDNLISNPISNTYVLTTDNDGKLFVKNNLSDASPENIIVKEAKMLNVNDKRVEFKL